MNSQQVLVVGGGHAGLLMALSLTRRGVPVRIVDKRLKTADESRAIVIQARTLELYAQLGIDGDVLARGVPARSMHVLEPGGDDVPIDIRDLGADISLVALRW